MARTEKATTSWVREDNPWGSRTSVHTDVSYRWDTSNRVSGGFVSLQSGARFRVTTPLTKVRSEIVPERAQYTRAQGPDKRYFASISSSAGGPRPSILYTNMDPWKGTSASNFNVSAEMGQRNQAVTEALLRIQDQKVNLGENFGTAKQTLHMLSGAVLGAARFGASIYRDRSMRPFLFLSYRDLRRRGVARRLAEKYLEYIYGWKPLITDVFTLAELAKSDCSKSLLFSASASASRLETNKGDRFVDGSYSTTTETDSAIVHSTVRCKLWAQLSQSHPGIRSVNQLGLINPLSLAWELTPWSFLVDWLFPLGSVLSSLTASAGLDFVDGSLSVRVKGTVPYRNWRHSHSEGWAFLQHEPGSGNLLIDGYTRERLFSWPLAGLWVNFDPFKGDRPFKAAALAVANLRGMRTNTPT